MDKKEIEAVMTGKSGKKGKKKGKKGLKSYDVKTMMKARQMMG